jgi:hypothetical protein
MSVRKIFPPPIAQKAKLLEDSIKTVQSTQRPLLRCQFMGEGYAAETDMLVPYPFAHLVLDLKKDAVVWLYQPNDDVWEYWAPDTEIPEALTKALALADAGQLVAIPGKEDPVAFTQVSSSFYLISTKEYALLRFEHPSTNKVVFQVMSSTQSVYYVPDTGKYGIVAGEIDLEANTVSIKAKTSFKVDGGPSGTVTIKNDLADLHAVLDSIIDNIKSAVQHISSMTTVGAPVLHNVNPASIALLTADSAKLGLDKTKLGLLLK